MNTETEMYSKCFCIKCEINPAYIIKFRMHAAPLFRISAANCLALLHWTLCCKPIYSKSFAQLSTIVYFRKHRFWMVLVFLARQFGFDEWWNAIVLLQLVLPIWNFQQNYAFSSTIEVSLQNMVKCRSFDVSSQNCEYRCTLLVDRIKVALRIVVGNIDFCHHMCNKAVICMMTD